MREEEGVRGRIWSDRRDERGEWSEGDGASNTAQKVTIGNVYGPIYTTFKGTIGDIYIYMAPQGTPSTPQNLSLSFLEILGEGSA